MNLSVDDIGDVVVAGNVDPAANFIELTAELIVPPSTPNDSPADDRASYYEAIGPNGIFIDGFEPR